MFVPRRMGLAKQLLRQRMLPIAEIAERVGYSSVGSFGVAFTRHMGVPPKRYVTSATILDSIWFNTWCPMQLRTLRTIRRECIVR